MARKKKTTPKIAKLACPIPDHCWEDHFKGNEYSDPARKCRHCGQAQRLRWVDTDEKLWKATWSVEVDG